MMSAPASHAARMTSGLLVSTEMNIGDSRRNASMTGIDTRELFVERGGCGAGPRRLTTDVDDGRALLDHAARVGQRRVALAEAATVGEGIRRDVEHAHHHGSAEIEDPIPALPVRRCHASTRVS